MSVAIKELEKLGYKTESLGLHPNDNGDIQSADVVLFPVPTTRDGKNVFCPLTDRVIPLDIIQKANKNALILSCGYSFDNPNCIDYLKLDSFCLRNAVPTAEGAIAYAINDTPFCLWQSRVLVIGCGRVAKILIDRLIGLKCDVTVSARKDADFAIAEALGIKHIHTNEVVKKTNEYDIIFNTIDVPLFKNDFDSLKNCFLYDLSSRGCIDFTAAQNSGIKAVKLPGIPGKIAPVTAGKIIAQTVNNLIGEWICKI